MEIKFANNASSRLASAIAANATKISILPSMGMRFPELHSSTDYFLCTITDTSGAMEIVRVTHVNGDDFTIVRAQEGTIAQSFPQNSIVENRLTAASIEVILNDAAASTTKEGRVRFATREEAVENKVTDAALTPASIIDYQLLPGILCPFAGQFEGVNPVNSITGKADLYWHICDGTGGTPDLRDKFVLGFSADHPMGTSGGTHDMKDLITFKVEGAALTEAQLPPHTHKMHRYDGYNWITSGSWYSGKNVNFNSGGPSPSESTGSGEKHEHAVTMTYTDKYYPPYYSTAWIMRLAR